MTSDEDRLKKSLAQLRRANKTTADIAVLQGIIRSQKKQILDLQEKLWAEHSRRGWRAKLRNCWQTLLRRRVP